MRRRLGLLIAETRHSPRDERGSVTAFVMVIAAAFIVGAGLVIDGGLALAGKTSALDEAQQAARTAATALAQGPLRDGRVVINSGPALAQARVYITATGDSGTVSIDGALVRAHVVHRQLTKILALFGMGQITVSADATARVEQGVTTNTGGP